MEEINEGVYKIPEGCIAKIKDNTITIRKSNKIIVTEDRCRDCKFFGIGRVYKSLPWYKTRVCLKKLKNKKDVEGNTLYLTVKAYGKICEHFERKI